MPQFLDDLGPVADAIRAHDWAGTPLGPIEEWSAELRTTVATVLASRFPQCIVWRNGLVTIPNEAFKPILGEKPEALGRPFSEVWAEVWDEIGPIAERAFAGEATYIEDFPLVVNRGGKPEDAWFTFCYSPIRDATGTIVGMLDTVVETTATVLARRQSAVIARELLHRVKNTITVAQVIARQTLRTAGTIEEARDRLESRLAALGRSHDHLLRGARDQSPVAEVVSIALRPHLDDDARVTCEGPEVTISARQAMSLTLGLHELATNALKHGALSGPDGTVSVTWTAGRPGSGDAFVFEWVERGGPPVAPPVRQGFGTQLIERVLPSDFGGTGVLDHAPDGTRFRMVTTMDRLSPPARPRA